MAVSRMSLHRVCALAALLAIGAAAQAAELTGKVVAIADGDTVTVLDAQNHTHKIRLSQIDAPERGQAFGNQSKQHLVQLVAGRTVKIAITDTDRYGRAIGEIFDGEININLRQVHAGMAWAYTRYLTDPAYRAAEQRARAQGAGLWRDPNPLPPWEFRKQSSKE